LIQRERIITKTETKTKEERFRSWKKRNAKRERKMQSLVGKRKKDKRQ